MIMYQIMLVRGQNGEPSCARWLYWSLMKDAKLGFENKRVKNQDIDILIRDQYSHFPNFVDKG